MGRGRRGQARAGGILTAASGGEQDTAGPRARRRGLRVGWVSGRARPRRWLLGRRRIADVAAAVKEQARKRRACGGVGAAVSGFCEGRRRPPLRTAHFVRFLLDGPLVLNGPFLDHRFGFYFDVAHSW